MIRLGFVHNDIDFILFDSKTKIKLYNSLTLYCFFNSAFYSFDSISKILCQKIYV